MSRPTPANPQRRRPGFTLVELMVVIVILSILVALLVPVISGAVSTARDAQVTAEITVLSQALASFNSKYGTYPPSRIMVNERLGLEQYPVTSTETLANNSLTWLGVNPATYASTADITIGSLAQRSTQNLRKIFPKFGTPTSQQFHDFNGNGVPDVGWILMEGHECLVLFLGGRPNPTGSSIGVSGFSKNPAYPFLPVSSGSPGVVASPEGSTPLFEFKSERLVDDDGDGVPGYADPRRSVSDARFYAYFSAYGSNGYDPNDMNMIPPRGEEAFVRPFRVGFRQAPVISPGPNPYTSSVPVPGGLNPAASVRIPQVVYINKESFQIISAGVDGIYGPGGMFAPDGSNDRLPVDVDESASGNPRPPLIIALPTASDTVLRSRTAEKDNITNFNNNKLD